MTAPLSASAAAEAASSDYFKPSADAMNNTLLLFRPKSHETGITNPNFDPKQPESNLNKAVKDELVCDVIVLDGALAGTEYRDSKIWAGSLIATLKGALGKEVLGRLTTVKAGQGKRYIVADHTAADLGLYEAWVRENEPAPF